MSGRLDLHHLPLSALLNGVFDAGLRITRAIEPREQAIPNALALSALRALA